MTVSWRKTHNRHTLHNIHHSPTENSSEGETTYVNHLALIIITIHRWLNVPRWSWYRCTHMSLHEGLGGRVKLEISSSYSMWSTGVSPNVRVSLEPFRFVWLAWLNELLWLLVTGESCSSRRVLIENLECGGGIRRQTITGWSHGLSSGISKSQRTAVRYWGNSKWETKQTAMVSAAFDNCVREVMYLQQKPVVCRCQRRGVVSSDFILQQQVPASLDCRMIQYDQHVGTSTNPI